MIDTTQILDVAKVTGAKPGGTQLRICSRRRTSELILPVSEIRRNFDRVQIETDRDAANDFAERKELNLSAVTLGMDGARGTSVAR